jgi:hypothetical protein
MNKMRLAAALLTIITFATNAAAEMAQYQAIGYVNGVPTEAFLEILGGAAYVEGPTVSGRIRNQFADYTFTGRLFGGDEGYIMLTALHTNERIDRVWIGVNQAGFALRTEDGTMYHFRFH